MTRKRLAKNADGVTEPRDLAVEINAAHAAATKAIAEGAAHAIRAGKLLLKAKAKVGHGQWAKWRRANPTTCVSPPGPTQQLSGPTQDEIADDIIDLLVAEAEYRAVDPAYLVEAFRRRFAEFFEAERRAA